MEIRKIHLRQCVRPQDRLVKVKKQLWFVFSVVQQFTERFKQKDSVLNTSAITAVTKLLLPIYSTTVLYDYTSINDFTLNRPYFCID